MKPLIPFVSLLAALLVAFGAPAPLAAQTDNTDPAEAVEADDIIGRVDRVLRVDADNARIWYAGVAQVDDWTGRLERSLLEILGPDDLRDPQRGLERLERLAEVAPNDRPLEGEAATTLVVVTRLLAQTVDAKRERRRMTRALQSEREAHLRTLEKLAALREIDEEIEARDRKNDEGGQEP